jgi:phosphate:Na+ symporter
MLATVLIASKPDLLNALGSTAAYQAINLHLVFNLVLALTALPFTGPILKAMSYVLKDKPAEENPLETVTALDPVALDRPQRALDCAARELLSMGQKIEQMLMAVEPLYDHWDAAGAKRIKDQDLALEKMHLNLKLYLAKLAQKGLDETLSSRLMELASISSSLDSASDAVARIMLDLAERLNTEKLKFSVQGREELRDFTDRVQSNVQLALNVMMNQNPVEARELVAAKETVRKVEQKLQRNHIGRLREGLVESIDTSNIHQETRLANS